MQDSGRLHLPTLAQFIISLLGILVSLSASAILLLTGMMSLMQSSTTEAYSMFSLAWTGGLIFVLLIPSAVLALLRMMGRIWKIPGLKAGLLLPSLLLLALPPLLVAGELISSQPQLAWLLLPPIQLLVVVIPLWWIIEIGRAGLHGGSSQRSWGVMSFGIVITPAVVMIAEIVLLVLLAFLLMVWLTTQPAMMKEMNQISRQLLYSEMDSQALENLISPLMQYPAVIFSILALGAGIIPLLEELLKPLAVWGLALGSLTPAEGFVAGLLCGSSFAMLESLSSMSSSLGSGWSVLAIGRMGTGILHSTSAALVGWGLASAWSQKRYLRLGAAYLLAVGMHGLWNSFSLLSAISAYVKSTSFSGMVIITLGQLSPIILVMLALIFLMILIGSNRILLKAQIKNG